MTDVEIAELERQGAELGRQSRLAQGLPAQVEDETAYAQIARMMDRVRASATPRSAA